MILPLYYNWRNLLARKLSSGLTFLVVAVVVFVLSVLLSFAEGIRASLVATGLPENIVVLRPGATSETTSILRPEEYNRVAGAPGIARQADAFRESPAGSPLISREMSVQTDLPRRNQVDGKTANVAVRGVDDVAFRVHTDVQLVEGRHFQQGAPEVIVGKAAQERYEITLGRNANRPYRVVGVFTAGGGALESEIWAPRTILADSYARPLASSVCLRLVSAAAIPETVQYINGPAVRLEARSEQRYYSDLAERTREVVWLTSGLIGIMAVGAIFAVANTMYATVDNRRREIAMLRTIGFGRFAIVTAIVMESLLLCVLACGAGLLGGLLLRGSRQDYFSDATFTVLAYELKFTPATVGIALAAAVSVGIAGALAPAIRAARINILQAVRKG